MLSKNVAIKMAPGGIMKVACLLLAISFRLLAAENDSGILLTSTYPYDLTLQELGKIVITASKTPRPITIITQKADVLTEKQIRNTIINNRNLSELIQQLPGASVKVLSRNDANWGAYGGIGPKYNTYLLQGLSVDGIIEPMSINASAIQRIEVQRGPASVFYPNYLSQDFSGNQSPLAGTVNLILKEEVKDALTHIKLEYGSYNTVTSLVYHENKFGPLHILCGLNYEKSDYTNYGTEDSWLGMLKNPEYQKGSVYLNSTIYLSENESHKINFFGNHTFHWGDYGRENRDFDNIYGTYNISYLGQLTEIIKLTARAGFRSYLRLWQEDYYTENKSLLLKETDDVRQIIIPVDISIAYSHFNNSNLTFGADYQYSDYMTSIKPVDGVKKNSNDATAWQAGIYLQEELQLDEFTLRAGIRYNNTSYNIREFGGKPPAVNNDSWGVILWSGGIKYRHSEGVTLYGNIGNSFMLPGLKSIGGTLNTDDIYMPGRNGQLPNPDLKPENGLGLDCGLDLILFSGMDLTVRFFYSTITNAIIDLVVSENPSQTKSVNTAGKTDVYGIEIGLNHKIEAIAEWYANITMTKSQVNDPLKPGREDAIIPFVPSVTSNMGLVVYLPYSIEVRPSVSYGGRIFDNDDKVSRNYFFQGEIVNLGLSKNIDFDNNKTITFSLKFYNITNNKFKMPWQFRDPGFNITAGAGFAF